MAEPILLVPGLVLVLFAAFAVRRALRIGRLLHAIPILPVEPIGALAPGFRLVEGTIESDAAMPSPFHRRDCVYYAYRVEEPGPVPKRLATGKNWAPTKIRDATGVAIVETRAALIRAPHENTTTLDKLDALSEQQLAFLHDAGIDPKHLPRFASLRITEYTLEPGDQVHVLGAIENRDDGKVFYRARRSPLAVSKTRDAGILPGLRNELFLFSASTALFLVFGVLFLVASFA